MKSGMTLATIVLSMFLAGCASQPAVAPATAGSPEYRNDLAECQRIAQQANSGQEVAKTGAVGAGVGAATGAIANGSAGEGAAIGALAGLTAGAFSADADEDRIVRQCLRDRGHQVY